MKKIFLFMCVVMVLVGKANAAWIGGWGSLSSGYSTMYSGWDESIGSCGFVTSSTTLGGDGQFISGHLWLYRRAEDGKYYRNETGWSLPLNGVAGSSIVSLIFSDVPQGELAGVIKDLQASDIGDQEIGDDTLAGLVMEDIPALLAALGGAGFVDLLNTLAGLDSDGDGISDRAELLADISPVALLAGVGRVDAAIVMENLLATDSDGDGFSDWSEMNLVGGNVADSASTPSGYDSEPDWSEMDCDGDGVPDSVENALGYLSVIGGENDTPSWETIRDSGLDTDGDGVPDAIEIAGGYDPRFDGEKPDWYSSGNTDTDGDGWSDACETAAGSDPNSASSTPAMTGGYAVSGGIYRDSDGDGFCDSAEASYGTDPLDSTSRPQTGADLLASSIDTDGDGVRDSYELALGSDPYDSSSLPFDMPSEDVELYPDTDNDGWPNVIEDYVGTDPNSASSSPSSMPLQGSGGGGGFSGGGNGATGGGDPENPEDPDPAQDDPVQDDPHTDTDGLTAADLAAIESAIAQGTWTALAAKDWQGAIRNGTWEALEGHSFANDVANGLNQWDGVVSPGTGAEEIFEPFSDDQVPDAIEGLKTKLLTKLGCEAILTGAYDDGLSPVTLQLPNLMNVEIGSITIDIEQLAEETWVGLARLLVLFVMCIAFLKGVVLVFRQWG